MYVMLIAVEELKLKWQIYLYKLMGISYFRGPGPMDVSVSRVHLRFAYNTPSRPSVVKQQ